MANDTTALARVQQTAPAPFEPENLDQAFTLAENLSRASLLPSHLRGKPADVFMTLLLARDLGLTAMQGITGIHVIEGKPSVSAGLAVALVKRSPLCSYFRLVTGDDTQATYETQRKGEPAPARMSYNIEEAKRAGLAGKKNWASFPAAMLRARCSMALARDVYPDLIANVYDPDELDAAVERAAEVVTAPPPPKPARQLDPPAREVIGQTLAAATKPKPTPKRLDPCGTCGRAPAEHPSSNGTPLLDANCTMRPVTKAPDPTANPMHPELEINPSPPAGMSADADANEAPTRTAQGFGDLIPEGEERLAVMVERSMKKAETEPQLDGIVKTIDIGVKDGLITAEERKGLMQPYRENLKRIRTAVAEEAGR